MLPTADFNSALNGVLGLLIPEIPAIDVDAVEVVVNGDSGRPAEDGEGEAGVEVRDGGESIICGLPCIDCLLWPLSNCAPSIRDGSTVVKYCIPNRGSVGADCSSEGSGIGVADRTARLKVRYHSDCKGTFRDPAKVKSNSHFGEGGGRGVEDIESGLGLSPRRGVASVLEPTSRAVGALLGVGGAALSVRVGVG